MKLTLISKNYGSQVIDTENFAWYFASTSSTVYKVVEHIFNDWYESSPDWVRCQYDANDSESIYSYVGAIRDGIKLFLEVAEEKNLSRVTTRDISNWDIEAAFQ